MGFQLDEAADRGRRVLANGESNPLKPLRRATAFQMLHADDDAVAALACLADFDEAAKRHAGDWILRHRVGDARGLQGRDRKACGDRGKAERNCKSKCAPARQECDDDAGERQRRSRPPGRFPVGGEIKDDAEAEDDGESGQQPARRYFGNRPLQEQPAEPGGAFGKPGRQHGAGTLASGVDIPGFGSRPSRVVLGHGRGAPNAHAT